jgi:leucine dehydrogenase
MKILANMAAGGFEEVVALSDPSCGLSGFMIIHDTTRGPAAGGIRIYPYQTEQDALTDGFRLASAMTFKAAVADLPVGGGKIVLMERPDMNREQVLHAVGRAIQSLGGRFLAGRDVGVPVEHGAWVRSETRFMVDESENGVGDLNRSTAIGVEAGARAALGFRLGFDRWDGVRVALQGAGGVGSWLAKILSQQGAELVVSETRREALESLSQEIRFREVAPDEIFAASEDLFCPCAVGGVVNGHTVDRLRARVVAGSANNVLAEPKHGEALFERKIAYAPDFLVNSGALIQGIRFLLAGETDSSEAIAGIGEKTRTLLEIAAKQGEPPEVVLMRQTREALVRQSTWRDWSWPEA